MDLNPLVPFLENGVAIKASTLLYTRPGRPMQNGFIERSNGTYRREILDAYAFFELYEVSKLTEERTVLYNHHRPHEALGNKTPVEWREQTLSNAAFSSRDPRFISRKNLIL